MRCEFIIYWSKAGEEAIANAQAVVQEWIDTARSLSRPIPEPKGKLAYA